MAQPPLCVGRVFRPSLTLIAFGYFGAPPPCALLMRKLPLLFSILIFQFSLSSLQALDKSLFFTLGPKVMLNTDDSAKSAPSPVMYSLGIGGDFTFDNNIFMQAHGSFFTNYYLWNGEHARPAEVENRTATALSALLDLTGGYTFKAGESQKHLLSLAAGLGFFFRYGILSNGVSESDRNRDTGTSVGDDVSDINSDFYSDLKFLYPEFAFSYSYMLSDIWKVGGEFRAYIPIGSFVNGLGADGMIFSLALKLSYK